MIAPLLAGAADDEQGSLVDIRLVLDRHVRRYRAGRVVFGGTPLRVMQLSQTGAELLEKWLGGAPVGDGPMRQGLARRLLNAGIVHPTARCTTRSKRTVTVVVPVKDNRVGIARLRRALAGLHCRTVVVDDGSRTPLDQADIRHSTARGPAAARNTGWRLAECELVAFLDSDTEPEASWLDNVLPLFDDPRVAAVAPRIRARAQWYDSGWWTRTLAAYDRFRSSLDMGAHPAFVHSRGRIGYVPSAALVVRRSALVEIDGFDSRMRFGEDVDLVWRLIDAGHIVRYQPEAIVWHDSRATLRAWLRQRFDYGTSAAPLAVRHPERFAPVVVSRWNLACWVTGAIGGPRVAVLAVIVSAVAWSIRLRRFGIPWRTAHMLVGEGQISVARALTDATRRNWWPLALTNKMGRRVLLACVGFGFAETLTSQLSVASAALRIADDFAYSTGVWAGCIRHRTVAPLLPRFH